MNMGREKETGMGSSYNRWQWMVLKDGSAKISTYIYHDGIPKGERSLRSEPENGDRRTRQAVSLE